MKKTLLWATLLYLLCGQVYADPVDYEKYYEVDLDEPVPNLIALERELKALTEVYDPGYIVSWNMGLTFSQKMANKITSFGGSETRLKAPGEDAFYDQIMSLPKEYYPYIGPHLHASAGISEKILNIPGIKETKNKFPEVIAPQLQDIEDLEFISPHLYILLMPQMWPSNQQPVEYPRFKPARSKTAYKYDPEFFARVLAMVPDQGFGGEKMEPHKPSLNDLRTLRPTATSPLTASDVRAFVGTLGSVREFGTLDNKIKLYHVSALLDFWEQKNGKSLPINGLKDLVNPCQRLALKIKWAGLEDEFMAAIAPGGFNLKEWAYTCDKTVKAHRVARMSTAQLIALENFKKGVRNAYADALNPKWRDQEYILMQSLSLMHKTTRPDVLNALKLETEITKEILPFGGTLLTVPLSN